MIGSLDFVILSTQDWDSLPTRKHRFARWWAEGGHRVLYVEQQMHWLGWLADVRRQFGRAWRWLRGPRQIAPNLWVYTLPPVLPFFQMSGAVNRLNNALLLPILRAQIKRLGFRAPVLWTYTPHSADFVGRLGERAAVYECVDDFTAAKGLIHAGAIRRMEQRLIRAVDLLIVTHPKLYEAKAAGARRAVVIPNGVDAEHMARAAAPDLPVAEALAGVKHPVIGYLGAVNYWIDTALLGRLARAHPDWTLAIVGPVVRPLANMKPLEGLPNVVLTGRVPYADVPRYVKAFDVCLNPYVLDEVAEHCSPLKLYEYVATGKPVVSVDMPEAHRFAGLIDIAHSAEEFIALVEAAVQKAMNGEADERAAARMAEAWKHTWRSRFEDASAALAAVLEDKARGIPAQPRLLVIIPAYNEEESLGRVIQSVREAVPTADVVVINDGSTDATPHIAEDHGAALVSLPYNLGIGAAMQTGFLFARERGYDVAVQVDGDGQHDPREIEALLTALRAGNADVVIGSRYLEDRGYVTPKLRRLGIVILAAVISLVTRRRITDPTSGFRALNRRAIAFCAADYPFDYPEPESVVQFCRAGLRIKEIPVTMNPRYGGQSSITPLRSAYYMVKVILAILIGLLRQRPRAAEEVWDVSEHQPS